MERIALWSGILTLATIILFTMAKTYCLFNYVPLSSLRNPVVTIYLAPALILAT